ncbi:MAG: DNA-directed RNA polymerase subunit P [Nanoarchaeota archaeon]
MVSYKCLTCEKKVPLTMMGRKVRCPYCGGKILYKPRIAATKVIAR